MNKSYRVILSIAVLAVFVCINTSAFAENGSPVNVVKNFAKAYFMLDNSMAEYINKDALEANLTERYLEKKAIEAQNCGYNITYLQKFPTKMTVKVLNESDSSATIEFDAITIRSVNPVYRIIGSLIGALEEYKVHEIVTMVKEDGEWKITPGAFAMSI